MKNDMNTQQAEIHKDFIDTARALSYESQLMLFHLMQHYDELMPYINQLDKRDSDTYQYNLSKIVLSHKAGIEIDVQKDNSKGDATDSDQINTKALCHALYELLELNWFIADTSRLLQQDDIMDNERIVTHSYRSQLAATIERAANKSSSLYEVVQESIGIDLQPQKHKPNIGLLTMPEDIFFYYGHGEDKGVLGKAD